MSWYLVIDREDVVMVIENEPQISEVITDQEIGKVYTVYEKSKESRVVFVTEYFREDEEK